MSNGQTTSADSWGEEVLPGVYLTRRRHNPHIALANLAHSAMMAGEPIAMEVNYERIHSDIEEMLDCIRRLEESNTFMDEYLKHSENGEGEEEKEGDGSAAAPRVASLHDDDEVVREAIEENKHVLVVKRRQLEELRALTRMHFCSHDHRIRDTEGSACAHCGDGPITTTATAVVVEDDEAHGSENDDNTSSTSSRDDESNEHNNNNDGEEGGTMENDDDGGAVCMSQISRFSL